MLLTYSIKHFTIITIIYAKFIYKLYNIYKTIFSQLKLNINLKVNIL